MFIVLCDWYIDPSYFEFEVVISCLSLLYKVQDDPRDVLSFRFRK